MAVEIIEEMPDGSLESTVYGPTAQLDSRPPEALADQPTEVARYAFDGSFMAATILGWRAALGEVPAGSGEVNDAA